jgi:hypothetical protein
MVLRLARLALYIFGTATGFEPPLLRDVGRGPRSEISLIAMRNPLVFSTPVEDPAAQQR